MTYQSDAPILLSAGGTGGHIFPAQSLAQELRRRGRTVALITDTRGAAFATVFGRVQVDVVAARNPTGNLLSKAAAGVALGRGTLQARRILRDARPAVVVGFGGYPSLPAMAAAIWLGVPTVIHEQNAVLGKVNRLLASRVTGIAASVESVGGLRDIDRVKATLTGNPVRSEIAACHPRAFEAPAADGLFNLVIFGGSQGAQILSEVVPAAVASLPPAAQARLRIVQQCRAGDIEAVRAAYARIGVQAELNEFIRDMPECLASAHLVIARSGATTVSELTAAGVPSIPVPYPHHADQQQLANAQVLADAGAAWLMPEAEFTAPALAKRLQNLLRHPERLVEAATAARALGRPDAASALADMVERIAPPRSQGGNGSSGKIVPLRRAPGVAA